MSGTAATVPLLHRFLGIGLLTVAAAAVGLRYLGIASMPEDAATTIGYALAAIASVLIGAALLVLKARIPPPAPGQSFEQYWGTPAVATKALPVWFLLEGAGTLAAIGYFFSGQPLTAVAAAVAIAAYWWSGPKKEAFLP